MVGDDRELFEFYQRYLWGPVDFQRFQASMVGLLRDSFAEVGAAALLDGGAVTAGTGTSVNVAAFTALNDDGYLCVKDSASVVDLADGHATLNRYDLVVARPLLVDNLMIARPTPPGDEVALTKYQRCELVAIQGTPGASPSLPAKLSGDVILASVYVPAAATTISGGDINQTTNNDIGRVPRFASSAKNLVLRSRTDLVSALVAYGGEGAEAIHAYGNNAQGIISTSSGGAEAMYADNGGNGTDANDVSYWAQQNIRMNGQAPAPTGDNAFRRITPNSIANAWISVNCAASAPSVQDGHNVDDSPAPSYQSHLSGEKLRFTFKTAMENANYAVATSFSGAALHVLVDRQTTYVEVSFIDPDTGNTLALDGTTFKITVTVTGGAN